MHARTGNTMLDSRDHAILGILQDDAETPVTAIAEKVSLSVSACSRRLQRLKDDGYVARQVALLDRRRIGLPMTVFVIVRTSRHTAEWLERFRGAIAAVPEIVEAHRLTGNVDYIVKIACRDVEHYDVIYKRLVNSLEFSEVSAYISMEVLKSETRLPTHFA